MRCLAFYCIEQPDRRARTLAPRMLAFPLWTANATAQPPQCIHPPRLGAESAPLAAAPAGFRAESWGIRTSGRTGPNYGCIITVTGGLPGKNNVPVLLLLGIKIPGAPPRLGATVACLPWLEVTVPVKPCGPKIGVPGRGKVEACEFGPGPVRGLARNEFDDGDCPCREWT
jgi:hypothetical protein